MTPSALATAAAWSYGIAAVGYLAFALRMALGVRKSSRGALLLVVTLATSLWAGSGILLAYAASPLAWPLSNAADALRYGAWFVFLAKLLAGDQSLPAASGRVGLPLPVVALCVIALVASVVLSAGLPFAGALNVADPRIEFGIRLGLAVFGLTLVEQLFRRAHPQARWGIKPLCVGLAGVFGYDLFLGAHAMLFGHPDIDIWLARGIANALVIPFIAVATARNTGWTVEMHMSREAVFHSTALFISGAFLLVVAIAGYYVRFFDGSWGRALQIEFLFAAALATLLVTSSGRFRSRLKVFVSKHFFSYRYDYRKEWLRFTRTLSTDMPLYGVPERVVMALADLVESPAGALWMRDEAHGYRSAACWNMPAVDASEAREGALARFLRRTGWIVSLPEYEAAASRYPELEIPPWLGSMPGAWLVVPLVSGPELIGFVVLTTPRTAVQVDWEVRDLLKTASSQAASYLGQIQAMEALLEARKFDAFNRMSAFVVHDLKNLVTQLSLMLKNAERHRANPEFQRDMLSTVENVVGRMNNLMLQLRAGAAPVENARLVDLEPIVRRVCAAKAKVHGAIELSIVQGMGVVGDDERLEHVVGHLLQNALDATSASGRVGVTLGREGAQAVLEVVDTGVGMTPEFVRERLFKPFETTKPAGMGIGVYESSQYIASIGGRLSVESKPGEGTQVRVRLPIGEGVAASPATNERQLA